MYKSIFTILVALVLVKSADAQIDPNIITSVNNIYATDCFVYNKDLFITSESIDYCKGPEYEVLYNYSIPSNSIYKFCTFVSKPIQEVAWSLWVVDQKKEVHIIRAEINTSTGNINVLDTIAVPNKYATISNPKSLVKPNGDIVITISKHNSFTEEISSFTFDSTGRILSQNTLNFEVERSPFDRLRYVWDVTWINDSTLLYSGWSTSLAVLSNDNLSNPRLIQIAYIDHDDPRNKIEGFYPSFGRVHDNILYYHDVVLTEFSGMDRYPVLGKVKIEGDSIYIDTLVINKTGSDLVMIESISSHSQTDTHYCSIHPYYNGANYFGTFSSEIFIQKFHGLEKQWTKVFSDGKNYYRTFFIEEIGENRIIIGGSVNNYRNSGKLEGFYIILDTRGNLLQSSHKGIQPNISLYPVPTSDCITIEGPPTTKKLSYKITNSLGQQVLSGYTGISNKICLEWLATGTYYFHIEDNDWSIPFVKH